MILGFLGKGGSGKSSVATQVALWLHHNNNDVLAIDADHNMDLAYNLLGGSIPEDMPYFGSHLSAITDYVGLNAEAKYDQAFLSLTSARFSFNPSDVVTDTLTKSTNNTILIMAAGPQTDTVMYGKKCSHSLTTPLKVYLPLLETSENQYVVVDEKAGADGVSTGIVTGLDVGIIVCEPALHSVKTAIQIAELMDFYETPYIFVANKVQSEGDKEFLEAQLGQSPTAYLLENSRLKRNPFERVEDYGEAINDIVTTAHQLTNNNRVERTVIKFTRNKEFWQ